MKLYLCQYQIQTKYEPTKIIHCGSSNIEVANSNPSDPSNSLRYFPRAVQSYIIDLVQLTEQISTSSTLTETDCQAIVYGLAHHISIVLQDGNIVKIEQTGYFK